MPADPATIADRADRLFDFAVMVTGCQTPWIALNELFGAQTPDALDGDDGAVPGEHARPRPPACRARRQARGDDREPSVTRAARRRSGGGTSPRSRSWRQVYFTSPNAKGLSALGPERRRAGRCAQGCAGSCNKLTQIGIPSGRIALQLQFNSSPGLGARAGLQPASAWFEIVKLEALAAKQVAREFKIAGGLVVGLGDVQRGGHDRDKTDSGVRLALGARPALCSGPGAAWSGTSVRHWTVGQLDLPAGVVCTLPAGQIRSSAVDPLARAIGDRDIAASLVLERLVLQQQVQLDARAVFAAELAFVEDRFRGNVAAYLAALQAIQLSRTAARGLLLDELPRDAVRARFTPARPGGHQISEFHSTYGGLRARLVETARPVAWLGGRTRGLAIETFAPTRIFSLARRGYVRTIHGAHRGASARRHGLSRHDSDRRSPCGDRGLSQPVRPRLRLRDLAREGGRGRCACRGRLRG